MSSLATGLWDRTLGEKADDHWSRERSVLRLSYLDLRKNIAAILETIAADQPNLTVHDVTHSDALWKTADLIIGESYDVTPLEAFILGAAFLVHDAGLSVVARQNPHFEESEQWRDALALTLRRRCGKTPTSQEIEAADEPAKAETRESLLRATHAEAAATLLTRTWCSPEGEIHLLERSELRLNYASLIGEIAASHWWPIASVRERFRTDIGSLPGFPQGWTVSPFKIACMLRVADAAHLDATRAPRLLMALRNPISLSVAHWIFQQRLQQPRVYHDRLVYTSAQAFGLQEMQAWWFCFHALGVIDQELRNTDGTLVDLELPRFPIKGVLGSDDPMSLTRYVPTQGWIPVDTRIRVSAVAELVRKLGGEYLYEEGPAIALRELLQNAGDGVRTRRVAQGHSPDWGEVRVELKEGSDKWWLSVSDTGVGMSDQLLTTILLDFGSSYWTSELMLNEHPGLMAKGFEPVGKFGIGFFSVFMLGDLVRVITRPYRGGERETRVLEFSGGLGSMALLRDAIASEYLQDGGTRIEVLLRASPFEDHGLLGLLKTQADVSDLRTAIAWLCPAVDFTIYASEGLRPSQRVIAARDWMTLPAQKLLARCNPEARRSDLDFLAERLTEIRDSTGQLIGRAGVCSWFETNSKRTLMAVTTVGGFRSSSLTGMIGVLEGEAITASREHAFRLRRERRLLRGPVGNQKSSRTRHFWNQK